MRRRLTIEVDGGGAGEPAGKVRRRLLPDTEVIGPPECPILHRWTLWPWGERKHENGDVRFKLMVHRFLPNADDRDMHDHPRGFVTLVLRGRYDDHSLDPGAGTVRVDRLRPGSIRHRPAKHIHRTKVGPDGCWTLVVMGPMERAWGFWRDGRWMYWRDHERKYGFGMRCPSDGDD